MITREIEFSGTGYKPDIAWRFTPHHAITADGTPIVYLNVLGVIFYTDIFDAFEDYAAIRYLGFQGVWSYLAKAGSSFFTTVGSGIKGLIGAGSAANGNRAQGQVGISGMLASMGFSV